MRYFGGGIGHLKNTPPQQVPTDLSSEEMAVDELEDDDDDPCASENEDLGTIDDMISDELEVTEDREDDHDDDSDDDSDEGEDQTVEDEDSGCSGDEGDYGYATS